MLKNNGIIMPYDNFSVSAPRATANTSLPLLSLPLSQPFPFAEPTLPLSEEEYNQQETARFEAQLWYKVGESLHSGVSTLLSWVGDCARTIDRALKELLPIRPVGAVTPSHEREAYPLEIVENSQCKDKAALGGLSQGFVCTSGEQSYMLKFNGFFATQMNMRLLKDVMNIDAPEDYRHFIKDGYFYGGVLMVKFEQFRRILQDVGLLQCKGEVCTNTPYEIARSRDYFDSRIEEGGFPKLLLSSLFFPDMHAGNYGAISRQGTTRFGIVDFNFVPLSLRTMFIAAYENISWFTNIALPVSVNDLDTVSHELRRLSQTPALAGAERIFREEAGEELGGTLYTNYREALQSYRTFVTNVRRQAVRVEEAERVENPLYINMLLINGLSDQIQRMPIAVETEAFLNMQLDVRANTIANNAVSRFQQREQERNRLGHEHIEL